MNFLALVKLLAQESNAELTENITSVAVTPATSYGSAREHTLRLITWIQQAWLEIQNDQPNWQFMQARGTLPLQLGQTSYDIALHLQTENEDVAIYDGILPWVAPRDRRYIWLVDTNQDPNHKQPCYYVPPEHFFGSEDRLTTGQGYPGFYSFDPDGCIVVSKAPSVTGLELEFMYRMLPHELADDADEPRGLPAKFHKLIVYWAMVEHAEFDEGDKQARRAWRNFRRMRNKLRLEQLSDFTMPGTR